MNLNEDNSQEPEVNSAALTDIIFIFLFFFLMVSTFANPNMKKVNNAYCKAQSDVPKTSSRTSINITIDNRQRIFFNNEAEPVVDSLKLSNCKNDDDVFTTSDTLLKRVINKEKEFAHDTTLIINADRYAHAEKIIIVMQAAAECGLPCSITFSPNPSK
jgi:biopolymer transport protein ExbD